MEKLGAKEFKLKRSLKKIFRKEKFGDVQKSARVLFSIRHLSDNIKQVMNHFVQLQFRRTIYSNFKHCIQLKQFELS